MNGPHIKVTQSFSAFGRDFLAGEIISAEDLRTYPEDSSEPAKPWDSGTIARRFANGFLAYHVEEPSLMDDEAAEEEQERAQAEAALLAAAGLSQPGDTSVTAEGAAAAVPGKGRSFTLPQ